MTLSEFYIEYLEEKAEETEKKKNLLRRGTDVVKKYISDQKQLKKEKSKRAKDIFKYRFSKRRIKDLGRDIKATAGIFKKKPKEERKMDVEQLKKSGKEYLDYGTSRLAKKDDPHSIATSAEEMILNRQYSGRSKD